MSSRHSKHLNTIIGTHLTTCIAVNWPAVSLYNISFSAFIDAVSSTSQPPGVLNHLHTFDTVQHNHGHTLNDYPMQNVQTFSLIILFATPSVQSSHITVMLPEGGFISLAEMLLREFLQLEVLS